MKTWSLIKDNIIINKVICDDNFIDQLVADNGADEAVELVDKFDHPDLGDIYDEQKEPIETIVLDKSQFVVKKREDLVTVGCREYDPNNLRDYFDQMINGGAIEAGPFRKTDTTIIQDNFSITIEEAQQLLSLLEN